MSPCTTNPTPKVLGGADTLAIVTKGIFYHILKTPRARALLVHGMRSHAMSYPPSYSSLEPLPYLDACIKEGLRMHPVVGHILERIVPASGLTLPDSTILPPGTIVGVNPWVMHYKESIFGSRPEEFRPERWLRGEGESGEVYEARLRGMKEADMVFGGGNRMCLGRPLALVETYKLVATVFEKFDVELEDPAKEWDLHKQWFVWPHDIKVRMEAAEGV
jgi:cytochrome P450